MKILKYLFCIVFSIVIIVFLSINLLLDNDNLFETIGTFISITTGFTITALSIIATSPFSKKLYSIEDSKDNSKTLLHTLISGFRRASTLFMATIGCILLLNIYPKDYVGTNQEIFNIIINDIQFLKSLIIFLTILSFLQFIILLHIFSKFVIKSATE